MDEAAGAGLATDPSLLEVPPKWREKGKRPGFSLPGDPLTGRCLPPVEATQTPLVQEDRGLSLAGIRFLLNRAEQSKGVTGT